MAAERKRFAEFGKLRAHCRIKCPTHSRTDRQNINERIKKIASEKNVYEVKDKIDNRETYTYVVHLCQETENEPVAITQTSSLPGHHRTINVAQFVPDPPDVFGGTDWVMIKYKNGDNYKHHCGLNKRSAIVMLTCNPDVEKGDMKVLQEFRSNLPNFTSDCYYLFEMNVAGACTINRTGACTVNHTGACAITPTGASTNKPMKMRDGLIVIIVLAAVVILYFGPGPLYILCKRFIVGAKGRERIPKNSFWRKLQSNFICRCCFSQPLRHEAMDYAINNDHDEDERDETLLPM